ncbi:MAG: rod shape-determining protein MreC, partial [Elusimicrobiota bacterium]
LVRVEGENYILREQNQKLSRSEIERDALQKENNELRSLLHLNQMQFSESQAAEVVAEDVRELFKAVIINKGQSDGIKEASAVVVWSHSSLVLVGRIIEVNAKTSKVMLITDPLSAIAIKVGDQSYRGLLEGKNTPWTQVKYLAFNADIKIGDEVLTAGLGGVFPPDIPIGRVSKIFKTPDGFFKEAQVEPYVTLYSVRHVLVLKREIKEMKEMLEIKK